MLESFSALQYLLIAFAGWVNRQQLDVIDYLEKRIAYYARCSASKG